MEKYRKLVRDKIPEILDQKGVPYEKTIADSEEYKDALIKKLLEETTDFAEAGDPEELADVLEVVAALRQLPDYQEVEKMRQAKVEARGAFQERIILAGEK